MPIDARGHPGRLQLLFGLAIADYPRQLEAGGDQHTRASGDRDAGRAGDWFAILRHIGPDRLTFADRIGASGRGPNGEFVEFLIPGVRGVPVGTFVALITLFVVLIGPVNYVLLRKRHQVGRLALTVPLIAAATAGSLFAYSTVMHGFGTKARQLAVTVHDPAANRAMSWTRTAVFAPQTPGDGLLFAGDEAVIPIAPPGPNVGGGRVDWTNGQTWSGDAFRGRTRTQFVTLQPRPERGRLSVEWRDGAATVVNGYESDFALLLLSDGRGRLYQGVDVPAGGRATLSLMTGVDINEWRVRLDGRLPEPPPGMEEPQRNLLRGFPMLNSPPDSNASFQASLAYRTASRLKGMNEYGEPIEAFRAAPLIAEENGSFVALLDEPALTEFGGAEVDDRGGAHLLIGRLDGFSTAEPPVSGSSDADRPPQPEAGISVRRPGDGR
ncbi:MAG: hypothetical protein AAF907_13115 [Planctomycetota bacterium]